MSQHPLPQARTTGIVTREMPDEVLVYDLKTHKAHCLNRTAATVWKYCDGQTSPATLAQAVSQDLKTEVKVEMIWLALGQLGKSNLLEEPIVRPELGVSRRQALHRIGWTAVAAPLIISIIAPSALAGLTCLGTPCNPGPNDPACACSGCCSGNVCVTVGVIAPTALCNTPGDCASCNCSGSPLTCQ